MTKGLVRIRLARFGRKNSPVYNIVVTQAYKARDSKPIEVLGTYNPRPFGLRADISHKNKNKLKNQDIKTSIENNTFPWKDIKLDFARTKYWIGCGAQPSDTVIRILNKAGILTNAWGKQKINDINNNREVIAPRREVYE